MSLPRLVGPASPAAAGGAPAGSPAAQPAGQAAGAVPQEALRARFVAELTQLGVSVWEASGDARAAALVGQIASRHAGPGRPVLLWDDPLLSRLGMEQALSALGLPVVVWRTDREPAALREAAARAAVGVTSVDFAVAASGTLVVASGPGRGRSVSLLPWVHVAVVEEHVLVATLDELFARLQQWWTPGDDAGGRQLPALPSSLTLITGPSRSGDIEGDLSIGVHGPGEVHVVLMGGRATVSG